MDILIPRRLNYTSLSELLAQHYKRTTQNGNLYCRFDWTATQWASLPEVVELLSWSSRLVTSGVKVEWVFRDPREPEKQVESSRAVAADIVGEKTYLTINRQLNKLKEQARQGALKVNTLRATTHRIREQAYKSLPQPNATIQHWLELETAPLNHLYLLTYLHRYEVFSRAVEAGIKVIPDYRSLPTLNIAPSPDTACLELHPIQSEDRVEGVVELLNDPKALARILGFYAGLDVVRGGALASILITELGNNIGEHSGASAAWLCTRLVTDENAGKQTQGDPTLRTYHDHQAGFLEVIVCDNGIGLTSKLGNVLNRDRREAVRNKYSEATLPKTLQLIDYAFDRLSSTGRDIVQLVHLQSQKDPAKSVLSSGLYWVWNVVRSHRGVISIHTGNLCAWYDFTDWSGRDTPQGWELRYPEYDESSAPLCGTTIRICLPLSDRNKNNDYPSKRTQKRSGYQPWHYGNSSSSESSFQIVWVGDLASGVPLRPPSRKTRKKKSTSSATLPGIFEEHETRLLQELQNRHFPLRDGDVLVLDLCGVRYKWAKQSVAPLCQFVLEMNYTSPVGRSTVVLWNVPSSSREVFELGIELGELFQKNIESAHERYSQLKEFRRAVLLIFDDESIRIFCGWPEAEQILGRLRDAGELDFDEMGATMLSPDDQVRLINLISENSHLFEFVGERRVRLRTWPPAVRAESWRQGMRWYNAILNQEVGKDGVHLSPEQGYFRLPSTGMLVKDFYQFRGLLANHQACARIAWHVAQIIETIKPATEAAVKIVSVSRSTMPLAQRLFDSYARGGKSLISEVLAESTIEELEAIGGNKSVEGHAVLITDVISSGKLCERIALAFPKVKWLATIALLDTRDDAYNRASDHQPIPSSNGIDYYLTNSTDTGPVYSLEVRHVERTDPTTIGPVPITAIDEVNVCAVKNFEKLPDAKEDFWEYAGRKPDAIKVGHFIGNNHHYLYKVDVGELLDAAKADGKTLLEFIVNCVVEDLEKGDYDPDSTIIIHPPHDHSYAERIAKRVQATTGALYRHVLYKDNFAGHWRFSPFVQHGIPLTSNTLVLIDDGTNTAETLMGLLDAATFGKPKDVLAYVGITRMPPHKNHLFTSLESLKEVEGQVKVEFALGLSIPVYSPRECPVCRFIHNLTVVEESSPLLRRYARSLRDEVLPENTLKNKDGFLWKYASDLSVTKLREGLETLDYHVPASKEVDIVLKLASNPDGDQVSNDSLLNLAFVICAEPDLAAATVFVPYLKKEEEKVNLLDAAISGVGVCHEKHLMTLVGLVFNLMSRVNQRSPSRDLKDESLSFWNAVFGRSQVTTKTLGRIIAFALSEAIKERGVGRSTPEAKVCHIWLRQLRKRINFRGNSEEEIGRDILAKSFAYLFVREAVAAMHDDRLARPVTPVTGSDLFDVATSAASKFFWHASDHVKSYISVLISAVQNKKASPIDVMYGPINSLIIAFDDLYGLQERLRDAERLCREEINESPGTLVYWDTSELNHSVAAFMQSLSKITEGVEVNKEAWDQKSAQEASATLSKVWDQLTRLLNPAFEEIFPEIPDVVDKRWGEFATVTQLPEGVAQPLKIAESLSNSPERVFIPRTLLLRFLSVAMQNLRTSAFRGWFEEEINSEAKAYVEIYPSTDRDGMPLICVKVVDNGLIHRRETELKRRSTQPQESERRQGHGIRDVRQMAEKFDAELVGPVEQDEHTFVELRMRHRVSRR